MNAPQSPSLEILWEDSHVLVINKPAGLASQGRPDASPDASHDSAERRVRAYLRPSDPASVYLGAVHRLDRPVTGVLAWAKTAKAARRLAADFENRALTKEYWAIVAAQPAVPEVWDDWLTGLDAAGVAHVVPRGATESKQAITHATRLTWARLPEGFEAIELRPTTGRTHQLRAQAASRGMPILGDARYGSAAVFADGIALHARGLSFTHPTTRARLRIVAPAPASWHDFGFKASADRLS